ncbi:hypothetical protein OE88DRAFT_1665510 [Heliocybe sulcata]|uniref:Uncharacterized protein n=1 Tax=Heliocybe sulcata TaxID=5364 RepID=A0A5C3MS29_9AGAM|nr:hypothetical protein OE88DRAFT_1665510 [Heliocybe sulcata]
MQAHIAELSVHPRFKVLPCRRRPYNHPGFLMKAPVDRKHEKTDSAWNHSGPVGKKLGQPGRSDIWWSG